MPKPLSIDLRERVLAAVAGGMSRRAAAERFGVAPSTAIKWVATWGPRFTSPNQGACDSMRLHAYWRRSWQRNPGFLTLRNGCSG